MKKEDAIKKIQDSEKEDFEVLTAEEKSELLDNYKTTEVEKEIGSRIGKVHQQYDDDFESLTGARKEANEKTYDFIKKHWGSLKEKVGDVEKLNKEITKLKDDIKNASGDEALKKELQSVRDTAKEKVTKLEGEIETLKKSSFTKDAASFVNKGMTGLVFKKGIEQSVIDNFIETNQKIAIGKVKDVNGNFVFIGDDDQPLINKDTFKAVTPAEMMNDLLKPILETGKKQPGTGTDGEPKVEKDKDGKITDVNLDVPENIKTNPDLIKYLLEKGMTKDSDEFHAAYKKYRKEQKTIV